MSPVAAALTSLIVLAGLASPGRAADPPTVGQPYGPLRLVDVVDGELYDLAAYRGRKLLLIEFASW